MLPKLSNDVQQAVQQNYGFAEAEADGAKFVVMSMEFYREMMGVGTEEELQDSLRAIDEGLADVDAGRAMPADQFFSEFDERHSISR